MPSKTITDPIDHKAHLMVGAWRFWSKQNDHTALIKVIGAYMNELNTLLEQRYNSDADTEIELGVPVDETYVADALDDLSEGFEEKLEEIAEEAGELFAEQERKLQALIDAVKAQHETQVLQQELIKALLTATGLVTHEERQEARDEAGYSVGDRVYHVNDNRPPRLGTVVSTDGGPTEFDPATNYIKVLWDGYEYPSKEADKYMRLADD